MNIKTLLITIPLIYSCSSKVHNNRKIASSHEYLDKKFESYFNGDMKSEVKHIREVGDVIRDFVVESAKIREYWKSDYKKLREQSRLRHGDRRKLKAYKEVFGDLPDRESAQFATRDVHRKSHGCFKAHVEINPDLDEKYQKGLFIAGAEYDGLIRFSNGNPNNRNDLEPDARGMALKLLNKGVLRSGVSIDEYQATELNNSGLLDILTINFPTFFVDDPLVYAKVNKYFLANKKNILTSKKLNEVLSVFAGGMNNYEKLLALRVNGSVIENPLFQQWFSMAPSRLGEFEDKDRTAVKYMMEPCDISNKGNSNDWPSWSTWEKGRDYQTPGLRTIKIPSNTRKAMKANRNYLEDKVSKTLSKKNFCVNLFIQPYISEFDTPIEDSTVIWHWNKKQKEDWLSDLLAKPFYKKKRESDKRKVVQRVNAGRIIVKADDKSKHASTTCEDLSFNPWNNVPSAHKPLGIIQRVKRAAYNASRSTRHRVNEVEDNLEKY
jgi:hypothetical protein